jgi:hypothetical protein
MQNGQVAILFLFFQDMIQEHDSHLNLGGKKGFGWLFATSSCE